MKKLLLLLILASFESFAQKTTIQIEKLSKPKELLSQVDSKKIYDQFGLGLEKASVMPDSLVSFHEHPFLGGLVKAYQDHRPFTLSPDMFWILISQGFARNISNHYNELRKQLVGFEGKKELIVNGEAYKIQPGDVRSQWEKVFPDFNKQIEKFAGQNLNIALSANFSTSTPTSKIVSQVAIMEAFKNYFDYKVTFIGCGLPYVTLEGSVKDWEKLKTKTAYLSSYQLEWWTKELIPILDQLIAAKRGKSDSAFWMNTVKVRTEKSAYGPIDYIDGWITKFFPFDNKGKQRKSWTINNTASVASEIVKVPFILEERLTGQQFKMEFWGGFIGLSQNENDFSLKPELGWAVNDVARQNKNLAVRKAKQDSLRLVSIKAKLRETNDSVAVEAILTKRMQHLNVDKIVLELKNVDEVPSEIFDNGHYSSLTINFRNEIKIPEDLSRVKIDNLYLYGKITAEEQVKVTKMFSTTIVKFNSQD